MKPYAAAGADRIISKIIKTTVISFWNQLLSLSTVIFSRLYTEAIIRPIYKGEDKQDINNYRPISLILNIIIEKATKDQLVNFLENGKYFVESQLGFNKNMGTEDAINRLHNELTRHFDNGKKCLAIFQDLSKAFDLVEHGETNRKN